MNPNLTEIAYILDRSGSMQPHQEAAITGFNDFLEHQLDTPGDGRFTLVLFDDEYLVPVAARPLEEVAKLDASTYVPRGSTALLDAIGRTIDTLGKRLDATPEPERPGKVVVAIYTDGLENASERYRWMDIASRIKHQREAYKWEFMFLAANQDAIATAAQLNIGHQFASNVAATAEGLHAAHRAASRKLSSLRLHSMGTTTSDFDASLSELVAEENTKTRHGDKEDRGK